MISLIFKLSQSCHKESKIILTAKMEDTITSADVGQERITQTLSFGSTFYKTSNVDYIEIRWHFAVMKTKNRETFSCVNFIFVIKSLSLL